MEKIIIELNEMDDAYDVEVFLWNVLKNKKSSLIDDLTDFGLTISEKDALLTKISAQYEILETNFFIDGAEQNSLSSTGQASGSGFLSFNNVTAHQVLVDDLLEYLSAFVSRRHGWDIEFSYDIDDYHLYWEFDYHNSIDKDITRFNAQYRNVSDLVHLILKEEFPDYFEYHYVPSSNLLFLMISG